MPSALAAADALPGPAKLLHENPPDPRVPYVIARIGPEGLPLLRQALTNESRFADRKHALVWKCSTPTPKFYSPAKG